jgi:hypothetical protein
MIHPNVTGRDPQDKSPMKDKHPIDQLRTSETRCRRVIESNLVGIFFPDPGGKMSSANGVFLEMVGYHSSEIEIIDVLKERTLADGLFTTSTLVKLGPAPAQKLVCTLSQTETVLLVLGLGQEMVAA